MADTPSNRRRALRRGLTCRKRGTVLDVRLPDAALDPYALGCERGRTDAARCVQALKNHPQAVGSNMLGRLLGAVDGAGALGGAGAFARGYRVGVFSYLERLVYAGAQGLDVAADVARLNAGYAAINTQSAMAM